MELQLRYGTWDVVARRARCYDRRLALTMTFVVRDTKIILKGNPSLTRMEISLKMLVKTWQPDDQGSLFDFRAMGISKADRMLVAAESIEVVQPEMEQLQALMN